MRIFDAFGFRLCGQEKLGLLPLESPRERIDRVLELEDYFKNAEALSPLIKFVEQLGLVDGEAKPRWTEISGPQRLLQLVDAAQQAQYDVQLGWAWYQMLDQGDVASIFKCDHLIDARGLAQRGDHPWQLRVATVVDLDDVAIEFHRAHLEDQVKRSEFPRRPLHLVSRWSSIFTEPPWDYFHRFRRDAKNWQLGSYYAANAGDPWGMKHATVPGDKLSAHYSTMNIYRSFNRTIQGTMEDMVADGRLVVEGSEGAVMSRMNVLADEAEE